jgi:hypothetical protein
MYAKIYKPEPSAMTSGRANLDLWLLEYEINEPRMIDPLTGNDRNTDTRQQLKLKFDSMEAAVAYAKAKNIPHRVIDTVKSKRISRSYSENFAYDRKMPWTH